MFVVAIVSASGGTGRTSLTANLASLLTRHEQPVLAVELDPSNRLGLYLGVTVRNPAGIVDLSADQTWHHAAQRNTDHVNLVHFGHGVNTHRTHEKLSVIENRGVRDYLLDLSPPSDCVVLIDTQRAPSLCFDCALAAADLILNVITAQPGCFEDIAVMHAHYERRFSAGPEHAPGMFHVLNKVNSAKLLSDDIINILRVRLKSKMLRYVIHQDEAMPEAMASNQCVADYAPHSQASHDLQGLADWLLAQSPR
jgi:cellulose synthase operon protein YhjQ